MVIQNFDSSKNEYYCIGLMSGTSLDGLDLAYCKFSLNQNLVSFDVLACETVNYNLEWKNIFLKLENTTSEEFCYLDRKIGEHFGNITLNFISKHKIKNIDFVASHGHTIFHQPTRGFTVQVGHGASMAAIIGTPVVCDFRSKDVSLGGNGAPLVPIGDQLLFSGYDFYLNLGGIANISFVNNGKNEAYDIVAVNIVLNQLAMKLDKEYDENGDLAASGNLIPKLLTLLDQLEFYSLNAPKSLGKEWVVSTILPILEKFQDYPVVDILATYSIHIANQLYNTIVNHSPSIKNRKVLVTGGGAFNTYIINLLQNKLGSSFEIIIPDEKTVKFKEAIIFALLGLLRVKQLPNCLKSVTGARTDSVGGCIYL